MEEDSYIERKIDFVTGHTGSTVLDINKVTLVAPVRCTPPRSSAPSAAHNRQKR